MLSDELIARLVTDAAKIARHFVGVNGDDRLLGLAGVRDEALKALLTFMPDDIAQLISNTFVCAVDEHAKELEAAGGLQ